MKFTTLVTALSLVLAAPAFAEDAKPTIAVLNYQQVMKDSTAAKTVLDQLESKKKSYQADISKKEEALQKQDQELVKQKPVLSKEAFEEKLNAFRAKATDVQKEVQSKKAVLDNSYERSIAEIQKVLGDVLADMAKEKGFIVALPTSQILYADKNLDISAEVLERLNKKLPKLDVKFDAPEKKDDKKK